MKDTVYETATNNVIKMLEEAGKDSVLPLPFTKIEPS